MKIKLTYFGIDSLVSNLLEYLLGIDPEILKLFKQLLNYTRNSKYNI